MHTLIYACITYGDLILSLPSPLPVSLLDTVFFFEDAPQLVIFGIVQSEIEGFGVVPIVQVATSLAGTVRQLT